MNDDGHLRLTAGRSPNAERISTTGSWNAVSTGTLRRESLLVIFCCSEKDSAERHPANLDTESKL